MKKVLKINTVKIYHLLMILTMVGMFDLSLKMGDAQELLEDKSPVEISKAPAATNIRTVLPYKINNRWLVFSGGTDVFFDMFEFFPETGDIEHLETFNLPNTWEYTTKLGEPYNPFIDKNVFLEDGSIQRENGKYGSARGLQALMINEKHYLFIASKWGGIIEAYRIEIDENDVVSLIKVGEVIEEENDWHIRNIIDSKIVKVGDKHILYCGGLERTIDSWGRSGLSSFEIVIDEESGQVEFVHLHSFLDESSDDEIYSAGVICLEHAVINGRDFLFTGCMGDDGVSSFELFPDRNFEYVDGIGENDDPWNELYLEGSFGLDVVTLSGNHYIVVGPKGDDPADQQWATNVIKVNDDGTLVLVDTLLDDVDLRLREQTRVSIHKVSEERAVVIVATREDEGFQTLFLDKEGKLYPAGDTHVQGGYYNGMESTVIDNHLFVFGGPRVKPETLNVYKLDLSGLEVQSPLLQDSWVHARHQSRNYDGQPLSSRANKPGSRISYLTFDVSLFEETEHGTGKLSLMCSKSGSGHIEIFPVHDSFDEITLTFENQPGFDASRQLGEVNSDYEAGSEVIINLESIPLNGRTLTLAVVMRLDPNNDINFTKFESKESGGLEVQPKLEILH